MSFNRDKNKQAQEIVFSRKLSKPKHPKLLFIKVPLVFYSSQKHAAIVLDEKPSFTHHMEVKTTLKSRRWLCMLHMSKYIQEGNNSYNE